MSSLSTSEKQLLEAAFDMGAGYVLDFTNSSFQDFFKTSVGRNIYHDRYADYGDSKAKRLRRFWEIESDQIVGKTISEMVERWENSVIISGRSLSDPETTLRDKVFTIANRLLGVKPETKPKDSFLDQKVEPIDISRLNIDQFLQPTINQRIEEIEKCRKGGSPLAVIFLTGSTLEGILLNVATRNGREFCSASSAPKDKTGKAIQIPDWKLSSLIDVSAELGILGQDVKKFSHAIRDFRNYIHPYEQASSNFSPDKDTADICSKVLEVALAHLVRSGK